MDYIQSLTELLQDAALDIRLKFVTIVLPNMEKYLTSEYILSGMSDAGSKVWIVLKRQSWISQIILLILTLISIVSILSAIYVKLTRGMCRSKARMDGKTVLITGANSGESYLVLKTYIDLHILLSLKLYKSLNGKLLAFSHQANDNFEAQ